jgi:hypothetical protein
LIQRPTWLRYSGLLREYILSSFISFSLLWFLDFWRLTGHLKAIRLWLDFPFRVVDSVTSFFFEREWGIKVSHQEKVTKPHLPSSRDTV